MSSHREAIEYATWWLGNVCQPQRPVYVIARSEAPHLFHQLRSHATGHTLSTRSAAVRQVLESRGDWRGNGFACVIDCEALATGGATLKANARDLTLHEFGHFLLEKPEAGEPIVERLPTTEEVTKYRRLYDLVAAEVVPWLDHELDFLRIMLHCWHRSLVRRRPLSERNILAAGATYGLSPIRDYLAVMRPIGELERYERTPLEEVAQTEPPAELVRFFEADCLRWKLSR